MVPGVTVARTCFSLNRCTTTTAVAAVLAARGAALVTEREIMGNLLRATDVAVPTLASSSEKTKMSEKEKALSLYILLRRNTTHALNN